ncbi:hypothetical protein BH24CHL3_BH24CHL3_03720 [soil metagenome]
MTRPSVEEPPPGPSARLHWMPDVAFCEDDRRVRSGHAAENFAELRHIALTPLRRGTTVKVKRLMCGWDETYLAKALTT